jgi:hypothetical protein
MKEHPERFMEVVGYGGIGKVWTNIQMDAYRVWFENQTDHISVVNATEGGARINGITEKGFDDAIRGCDRLGFEINLGDSKHRLPAGSSLAKKLLRIERELRELKNHFEMSLAVMSKLIAASNLEDKNLLERKYNDLALNIPKHSSETERFLEAFSIDERFRTKRRLSVYDGQRFEHYQTNAALHQKLVASCGRAIQVLSQLRRKLNGSPS